MVAYMRKDRIVHFFATMLLSLIVVVTSMAFSKKGSDCISMKFAAYEDGECIATFDMYSDCTFHYVNMEEPPVIEMRGTYVMEDGPIERGCNKRITIYTDQGTDQGKLVWPLQQELFLMLGEFDFNPVK